MGYNATDAFGYLCTASCLQVDNMILLPREDTVWWRSEVTRLLGASDLTGRTGPTQLHIITQGAGRGQGAGSAARSGVPEPPPEAPWPP